MTDEQLKMVQLNLIEIIHNYSGNEEDSNYFKSKLDDKGLNWGLIYRVAVNFDVYELSDLIINSHNYDLYFNDDKEMTREIKGCIISRCDDFILHYLADNYYPTDMILEEIMAFYSELDADSVNNDIFNQFKFMNKVMEIKRLNKKNKTICSHYI